MDKSCNSCCWENYKDKFCFYEVSKPEISFCNEHNPNCIDCGFKAEYSFNEKHYCTDCLLNEFEVEQSTVTHYYHGGEYIGSDDDMNEVINNLDENVEEI